MFFVSLSREKIELMQSGRNTAPMPPLIQKYAKDVVGVLLDAGLAAMLRGKEQISSVRLAFGRRAAQAVLQEHGILLVVLPSAAADGQELP